MKMVIFPPVEASRLEKIVAAAAPMTVVNASDELQALRELASAEAFFGKITLPLLRAARQLQWVQSPTASLEHYIFPELIDHPCKLTNMRGLYSDVVADHVFGFLFCFARNLHIYIRQQAAGVWGALGGESDRPGMVTGPGVVTAVDRAHFQVADMTMGIVGFGSIGAEIGRRALACDMRVIAVDPVQTQAAGPGIAIWPLDCLPDLLAQSDFVVISAPHTPRTEKMFRRAEFQQMKRSAYLINVGRGAIVDLNDLVGALAAGEIAGAGLDVFETEPLPSGHPLWKMENVIITPHVASVSPRMAERHLAALLDNVGRFVRGEPLRNVVNKEQWF